MTKGAIIVLGLLAANIPVFLLIGRAMFGSWSVFWNSAKWIFIPDLWSLLRGRFLRDMLGETKVDIFILTCMLVYFVQLIILMNFFDF